MKLYRFEWYDVVAGEDESKDCLSYKTPTEMLARKRNTVGSIYKEDDFAITILRDEDDHAMSYLALPKCLIIRQDEL